jgi:hypothetical protein
MAAYLEQLEAPLVHVFPGSMFLELIQLLEAFIKHSKYFIWVRCVQLHLFKVFYLEIF